MNTNQNQVLNFFPATFTQTFILIIALGLQTLAACGGDSRELTRARAQQLILQDPWTKKSAMFPITFNWYEKSGIFGMIKEPANESREEAIKRALPEFFKYYPRLAAAHHLGLITIEPVLVQENLTIYGSLVDKIGWGFQIKIKPTAKGLALAKEMGLPESETEIPLATKKFVGITGITKLAVDQAKADFVWQWVPNRLAKALDHNTDEFKALPKDLQQALLGRTNEVFNPKVDDWGGEQPLSGLFRRYDDGWRLERFW